MTKYKNKLHESNYLLKKELIKTLVKKIVLNENEDATYTYYYDEYKKNIDVNKINSLIDTIVLKIKQRLDKLFNLYAEAGIIEKNYSFEPVISAKSINGTQHRIKDDFYSYIYFNTIKVITNNAKKKIDAEYSDILYDVNIAKTQPPFSIKLSNLSDLVLYGKNSTPLKNSKSAAIEVYNFGKGSSERIYINNVQEIESLLNNILNDNLELIDWYIEQIDKYLKNI